MDSAAIRRGLMTVDRVVDRQRRRRAGFVVLLYHRVGARSSSPIDLPMSTFRTQLDRLVEAGVVCSLDDALAGAPPGSVVITFDDGTADWVDVALPELLARRLPATFYVATDFVERQRSLPAGGMPISWAGLREMAGSGLDTIGSHTHTHRVLRGVDASTAGGELRRSVDLLGERVGVDAQHFAYPKAVAPSPAAEVAVRRRFASAALAGNRANCTGADVHRLGRHAVLNGDEPAAFEATLGGGRRLEGWVRERRDAIAARRR